MIEVRRPSDTLDCNFILKGQIDPGNLIKILHLYRLPSLILRSGSTHISHDNLSVCPPVLIMSVSNRAVLRDFLSITTGIISAYVILFFVFPFFRCYDLGLPFCLGWKLFLKWRNSKGFYTASWTGNSQVLAQHKKCWPSLMAQIGFESAVSIPRLQAPWINIGRRVIIFRIYLRSTSIATCWLTLTMMFHF